MNVKAVKEKKNRKTRTRCLELLSLTEKGLELSVLKLTSEHKKNYVKVGKSQSCLKKKQLQTQKPDRFKAV